MNKNKKIALLGVLAALAIVLSYLESLIPPLVAIPGVKIGLANIAVMLALYKLSVKEAALISICRNLVIFLLFGGLLALLYSLAGSILSLTVMFILKKFTPFSEIGVSVAGGVTHNIAQIVVAVFTFSTPSLMLYLPVLLVSGTIAGIVIGICSGVIIKKIK
ncbi:MAG: Gx transporter family protein [Ruminococcaceae bacterium]|nr:Gx transporter family protein [Oscillospiraceae bacterium]